MEIKKVEGKTEEEVLKGLDIKDIHYEITEVPAKLFKSKKVELKYIEKDEIKNYIKKYIDNFAKSLNKTINVEIRENEVGYNIMLISEENSILIGKDGKTLNSIQLLLHQAINNLTGFNIRINVDAANYKSNKERRLEREIKRICKEVLNSKIEAKLDPMNSYDRRIVHNVVSNFNELESKSFDEEPNRYVTINYKED